MVVVRDCATPPVPDTNGGSKHEAAGGDGCSSRAGSLSARTAPSAGRDPSTAYPARCNPAAAAAAPHAARRSRTAFQPPPSGPSPRDAAPLHCGAECRGTRRRPDCSGGAAPPRAVDTDAAQRHAPQRAVEGLSRQARIHTQSSLAHPPPAKGPMQAPAFSSTRMVLCYKCQKMPASWECNACSPQNLLCAGCNASHQTWYTTHTSRRLLRERLPAPEDVPAPEKPHPRPSGGSGASDRQLPRSSGGSGAPQPERQSARSSGGSSAAPDKLSARGSCGSSADAQGAAAARGRGAEPAPRERGSGGRSRDRESGRRGREAERRDSGGCGNWERDLRCHSLPAPDRLGRRESLTLAPDRLQRRQSMASPSRPVKQQPRPAPPHQGTARRALAAVALSRIKAMEESPPAEGELLRPVSALDAETVLSAFAESGLDGPPPGSSVRQVLPPAPLLRSFLQAAREAEQRGGRCLAVFHGVAGCAPTPEVLEAMVQGGLDPSRCRSAIFGKGAYVATTGAKAHMYAVNGKRQEKHGLPLQIFVLLLALKEGVEVGQLGLEHDAITADSTSAPTQFCIPRGCEGQLLATHLITIDADPAGAAGEQASPFRRRHSDCSALQSIFNPVPRRAWFGPGPAPGEAQPGRRRSHSVSFLPVPAAEPPLSPVRQGLREGLVGGELQGEAEAAEEQGSPGGGHGVPAPPYAPPATPDASPARAFAGLRLPPDTAERIRRSEQLSRVEVARQGKGELILLRHRERQEHPRCLQRQQAREAEEARLRRLEVPAAHYRR
eukprot:TRINITY_DN12659_c0_g1_i2.p1 TRINITY_DN12659_c0_g1~~TRINITY_DN12659_c0_g1_i2.p1  ORF type:complete len:804 (+),score=230.00 TRINITY_DN12659_c0_g1_i2:71-2413(+)